MQKYFLCIYIIGLSACHYNNTSVPKVPLINARDTVINFNDSIGSLAVSVPDRYDTFFKWTQYSDCSLCGTVRYRFQRKSLPIFKESGWYWKDREDSVDQLTLIHLQYLIHSDSMSNERMKYEHAKLVYEAKIDPVVFHGQRFTDTLMLINKKPFSFISSEKFDSASEIYSKAYWSATLVKGNLTQFQFTLITKTNDSITQNFIRDCRNLAERISEVKNQ
jgi:hypothetical protein